MGDNFVNGIPQFNGCGYDDWQFRMKIHLESHNLEEVLTGNPPTTAAERLEFLKKDRKAKERLVSFVHSDCLSYVRDKDTAKAMWESLQSAFAKKSVVNQLLLRKQLTKLQMKNGDAMTSHLSAFESLVRQLKLAGVNMEEGDLLAQLFLTLPEKFDPLVTALQNLDDGKLTFAIAKGRLLAEETKLNDRNQEEAHESKEKIAFASKKNFKKKFKGKCFKCNKFGHQAKDCRSGEARSVSKLDNSKGFCFMADRSIVKTDQKKIIFKLDSGASDHLANESWYFSELEDLKFPIEINVAKDKQSLLAKRCGKIQGLSNAGVELAMKDVLYIPELRDNLLSVRKLTSAGAEVQFRRNKAFIMVNRELLATAYLRGNLYELEINIKKPEAGLCKKEEAVLWHRRLGHIGQHGMDTLMKTNLIPSSNLKSDKIGFCDVCVEGKQSREPFDGTRIRAKRPLERIHSDVCGPLDPIAMDGSKYFVSFIDDYSHFAMIFPIRKKSEVFESFQEYEALSSAMFGTAISKLTIDQGREYLSKEQERWYKYKGIQVQPTISYSPQQNGVAERFNRTLAEKVRAMLIESGVPKKMWAEAAVAATYIINRSPTRTLENSATPAELWFGSKPDLEKLRVFGCKAYAWIPDQCRKKLDSKSRKSVMVGYAPNGYRLWDMERRKVFTARDVKFDETHYPYKSTEESEKLNRVATQARWNYEQEQEADNVVVTDSGIDLPVPILEEEEDEFEDAAVEHNPEPALPPQQDISNLPEITIRRSERECRRPSKLLDFIIGSKANAAAVNVSTDVPENYKDVFGRTDEQCWKEAIDEELGSMEKNKVWEIVKKPPDVKLLKSKWVFRIKEDEHGNPIRYKARLVAKGFLQKYGVDYNETYAPVAKLTTVRAVLAVGVYRKYIFHHLDVKTAFLHGDLEEEIYLSTPDGIKAREGMAYKLLKSLYGLKQAPRCWNDKFNKFLLSIGFKRSKHDSCLYTKFDDKREDVLIVIMYVDDLLIAGSKLQAIEKLKKDLSVRFEMSDCGVLKYFLGIKIEYETGCLKLSQEASIEKVLNKFGMLECNSVKSPMEKGLQLNSNSDKIKSDKPYRELLGSLMYIMLSSRPDLCFSVAYMGRHQQNPSDLHWQHLKRIVRYLKGTKTLKLCFNEGRSESIVGYADADWASDIVDRKSVSGYIFKIYGCTVSWSSKKQSTVATSSSEAEYIALSAATSEAIWLRGLMQDLKELNKEAVTIYEDNRGCIGMANNAESKRAKHIDIKHHFIRDNVANGLINIAAIGTKDQLADIFTKSLDTSNFLEFRTNIGLND